MSFVSIIVIALLGVTAFLGIRYAAEAMRINGSAAYNAQHFRDLEVVSTLLLTEDDVESLRGVEGVSDVEPLWQTVANAYINGMQESVTVITVTERLSRPIILEGRLPETLTECAVEKRLADRTGWRVGDAVEWLEMTESTGQYFLATLELSITGIVEHPDHANLNVPDSPYILVIRDAFDHEALDGCCMKALVAVDGLADAYRFSAAYDDSVALVSDRVGELAAARTVLRDEQVRRQAQEQIDALGDSLVQAKQTLEDGRKQLDEGWRQLEAAERQLSEGERQLGEAKIQLDDSEKQLLEGEQQLQEARAQLDETKAKLEEGAKELQSGNAKLNYAERQLEEGWEQLESAKETVRSSLQSAVDMTSGEDSSDEINWAEKKPSDVNDSHATAKELWITDDVMVDLDKNSAEAAKQAINAADIPDSVLCDTYDALHENDPDAPEYDPEAMRAYIVAQASAKVDAASSDYDRLADGAAQWDEGHGQYLRGRYAYNQNKKKFDEAMALYEAGEQEYAEALAQYEEGLKQYTEGKEAYDQGLRNIEAGRDEIDAKRKELEEGEKQYADGLDQYEYGLTYRENAIAQLNALEPSRWIVLDGRGNTSFVQLRTSSQNLSSLQMTFSLLFVVIGALVIYATVSKMVDEQRTLVGATKALGFYNWEIFAKYLLFGLLATVFGTFLGILLARFWLEGFILSSYNTYFTIDLRQALLMLKPTLIVLLGAALLATAAVTFACQRLVRMPAIQLMQAPVPKGRKKAGGTGKHLLSLYSRLVLLNIRTDIKRVLVTVVSVAGCCTLMVIGFTLKYAMDKCVENQYTTVATYDGCIRYVYGGDLEEVLKSAGAAYVPLYDDGVTFRIRDVDMGELFCGDIAAIEEMYRLNDWQTGEPLAPTDDGILIQRRLAEIYDLTVSSEFELTLNATNAVTVRVAGIFENYIGRPMVMSPAYYTALCGEAPMYNAFFVRFGDGVDREALMAQLEETLGYQDYAPADQGKAMFEASTSVINAVVALFILMAAVMAGVVLLNLTNIYILQKKRELTIMRVNGFTTREVISYVTRETVITTILGILIGLIVGSVIGYRIVRALEQSFVQLERSVCFSGWLFAAAMTVLFAVVVNVIALRKVKDLKLTDVT